MSINNVSFRAWSMIGTSCYSVDNINACVFFLFSITKFPLEQLLCLVDNYFTGLSFYFTGVVSLMV